jgi:hypothetical protein
MGRIRMHKGLWYEILKKIDHQEVLKLSKRIVLKWIVEE